MYILSFFLFLSLICLSPIDASYYHHSSDTPPDKDDYMDYWNGHCHACCTKEHEWSLENDAGDYIAAGSGAYGVVKGVACWYCGSYIDGGAQIALGCAACLYATWDLCKRHSSDCCDCRCRCYCGKQEYIWIEQ
jgi:hypothetical protein